LGRGKVQWQKRREKKTEKRSREKRAQLRDEHEIQGDKNDSGYNVRSVNNGGGGVI